MLKESISAGRVVKKGQAPKKIYWLNGRVVALSQQQVQQLIANGLTPILRTEYIARQRQRKAHAPSNINTGFKAHTALTPAKKAAIPARKKSLPVKSADKVLVKPATKKITEKNITATLSREKLARQQLAHQLLFISKVVAGLVEESTITSNADKALYVKYTAMSAKQQQRSIAALTEKYYAK